MNTFRTLKTGALVAAALTVASCSSDSSGTAATLPADIDVEVDAGPGIKFDAESYSTEAGTITIGYINKDSQRHTLVVIDAGGTQLPGKMEVVRSGDVQTKEFTLEAGTYTLFCDVPGHQNMKAELIVE